MLPFVGNPYVFTYLRSPKARLESQYRFMRQHLQNLGQRVPELLKIFGISAEEIRDNTTDPSESGLHVPDQFIEIDRALYDWAWDTFSSEIPDADRLRRDALAGILGRAPRLGALIPWIAEHYLNEAESFGYRDAISNRHAAALAWHREVIDQLPGNNQAVES